MLPNTNWEQSCLRYSLWIKVLCLCHFWRWFSTWHRSLWISSTTTWSSQNCQGRTELVSQNWPKRRNSGIKCPEPSATWWRGLAGGYCHSGWLAAPRLATTRDRSGAPQLPPWPCVTPMEGPHPIHRARTSQDPEPSAEGSMFSPYMYTTM